jgi:2-dehydropantoate 2-reductase
VKRVLVVGVGAIGGIFAARLATQAQVVGLDSNGEHARRIAEEGLRVDGLAPQQVRFPCVTQASDLRGERFDAIVFLVKSKATAPVLQALQPLLEGKPLLVTLQNGMGNAELLAATGAPVARGVMMGAGRYVEPGHVEHLIAGSTWLGPVQGSVADLQWFADLLAASGLPCELVADPMAAVWSKFVFNCVMNPIGALVGGSNAARYEVPEVGALIDTMADECQRVVRALGGSFAFDPMAYVHKVREGKVPRSRHAGSMALDIARGAPTEIDELTGWVVAQADRLGIPAPACRSVTALVKGLEYAARARHQSQETAP